MKSDPDFQQQIETFNYPWLNSSIIVEQRLKLIHHVKQLTTSEKYMRNLLLMNGSFTEQGGKIDFSNYNSSY